MNKIYSYVRALSAIGILLSVYLLVEQIFRPSFQPCNINSSVNCNAVISGSVSKTLGLPTPLYGLIGYIVMLWAGIFCRGKDIVRNGSFRTLILSLDCLSGIISASCYLSCMHWMPVDHDCGF